MFELQLLGPVTLRREGAPLALPTQRVRAVLALLALSGPAARSRVAALLWPDLDDGSARRNLRRELARLRDAGAADVLQGDGDVLALAPALACDARRFETLAASAPDDALALWHGTPADGLQVEGGFDGWLDGERNRLRALRRQALQQSAAAHETRGDAESALRRVETLLADDPLEEAQHRHAMRLLAAAGRREAAIAQYERCRALLLAELGLAPMAETEALLASLRGPAPAAAPPRTGAGLPAWSGELPLVGRADEWSTLEAAWSAGRTLLVEGVGGIGKTRLACDFAAAQGAYALVRCRGADHEVPYASFTRALRRLAGETLAQAALPAWVRYELSRVLPELQGGAGPITSAEERRRFFEAGAAAWRLLADGNFDAVVVDDLHLADEQSRTLFAFVAEQRADEGTAGPRELFVCRPELPEATLRALLDGARAERVVLQALADAPVLELVRRLSGAADPRRFAARLRRATGGHPFFVAETLRHWLALGLLTVNVSGVWQTPFDGDTDDYRELPVPDSVREAVLARVRRLPDAARRVVEAAALATEPFGAALLAGACALSEVETLAAIETAVQAQLLQERQAPGLGAGYGFVHDLAQLALDGALAPERRRLVHRRLALGGEAAALAPAEIARHWEAGGEPRRAVAHRLAAAKAASALYADTEAEAHRAAALADGPTLAQRLEILSGRWNLLRYRDDGPGMAQAIEALDALQTEARQAGAMRVAQDAAIEAAHAQALCHQCADALARIDAVFSEPVEGVERRALALMVRTQALNGVQRTEEAVRTAAQALALEPLPALQRAQILHALIYSHFLLNQPAAAIGHARQTLAIWQQAGTRRSVARAHANIALLLSMLGDQPGALAEYEQSHAIAVELHLVELQRQVANDLAYSYLHVGRAAEALAIVEEALAISDTHAKQPPVIEWGILVLAHWQLGNLGAAIERGAAALALALQPPAETRLVADAVSMVIEVHACIGDHEGALALAAELEGRSLAGLEYLAIKVDLNLIVLDLQRGDLASARARLQALGDPDAQAQPVDRHNARLRQAELALAEGDAAAALRWLEPLGREPLHVELWALSCAARLDAHEALRQHDDEAAALADAALASGVLPAWPAQQLRRARRRAALRSGDDTAARRLGAEIGAQTKRLTASLAGDPARQHRFIESETRRDAAGVK